MAKKPLRWTQFGRLWAVTVLATCALAAPLVAQTTSDDARDVLEEITVTARKREVALQEAPIAVATFDGDALDRVGVVKLDDFNSFVPGLVVGKNDGAGRVVAIRGIGWETAQNLSTQPGVLVYVDGVYMANPLALGLDLGEIERVEVLRGPQGTEFGQSATGGAVNIITKKAVLEQRGGFLDLQVGDYGLINGRAGANLALGDRAALAFSLQKHDRDGYAEIRGGALDGYELDDADSATAHLSFLWRPQDRVQVELGAFWQDADHHGAAQKHIADPNPDARQLSQDSPGTFALENLHLRAVVRWDTPWGFTMKSLTGVQNLDKQQRLDGDRLTSDLTAVNLTGFYAANFDYLPYWDNNSEAFSQELALTGGTSQMDWVFGLYYLDHENDNDFLEAVGPGSVDDYRDQLNNPGPDTLPPFQPPLEFVETRGLTREDSAAYGQVTYRFNQRWAGTLGARYQRDESRDNATQFWFIDSEQVLVDNELTWKAGLDLRLADNRLLYALVSTGWKNGGNNPGALNGALQVPVQFAAESVTALEIGAKNTFAGRRGRLNLTAYYYDYSDYQFIQEDPVPFAGGTGNIPSVEIYGLESEWGFLLGDAWRVDGFLAIADGKINSDLQAMDTVDFLNSGFGRFTETGVADRASLSRNLRGNTPPKLVETSGRLSLAYHRPLGDNLLRAGADVVYRGEYQFRVFNNPATDTVPAYTIANIHAAVDFKALTATVAITNLTDKDGVNARFSNPFGLHTTSEEFIPPRQISLRLRYAF